MNRAGKMMGFLICTVACLASVEGGRAQVTVSEMVVGCGGSVLADSSYRIVGTLGQAFVGILRNRTRVTAAGFWHVRINPRAANLAQPTDTVPGEFRLRQNYPNPFNPETKIEFQLPQASHVVIKIFNILGQEVLTLTDEQYKAGAHSLLWDGRGSGGLTVASGVYLYWLRAGEFSQARKMNLLR